MRIAFNARAPPMLWADLVERHDRRNHNCSEPFRMTIVMCADKQHTL
jgi:hypothetical protein